MPPWPWTKPSLTHLRAQHGRGEVENARVLLRSGCTALNGIPSGGRRGTWVCRRWCFVFVMCSCIPVSNYRPYAKMLTVY